VVDCSGLENLAGIGGKTPETAHFSDIDAAQDAMFTPCSAGSDGAKVGTLSTRLINHLLDPIYRMAGDGWRNNQ
jgi:hypothetical protein